MLIPLGDLVLRLPLHLSRLSLSEIPWDSLIGHEYLPRGRHEFLRSERSFAMNLDRQPKRGKKLDCYPVRSLSIRLRTLIVTEDRCRDLENGITRGGQRWDQHCDGMTRHGRYNMIAAYHYTHSQATSRRPRLVPKVAYAKVKCPPRTETDWDSQVMDFD